MTQDSKMVKDWHASSTEGPKQVVKGKWNLISMDRSSNEKSYVFKYQSLLKCEDME
jgi:hypothetical protein